MSSNRSPKIWSVAYADALRAGLGRCRAEVLADEAVKKAEQINGPAVARRIAIRRCKNGHVVLRLKDANGCEIAQTHLSIELARIIAGEIADEIKAIESANAVGGERS
jgi:hypothetical protein